MEQKVSFALEEKCLILKIRHLEHNDFLKNKYLESLMLLSKEDLMNRFGYSSEESVQEYVNSSSGILFYISRNDFYHETYDKMLACLHFVQISEDSAEIGFHVVPSQQRTGLAHELLMEAIQHARLNGIKKLITYCAVNNIKVQRLLTKLGFHINLHNQEAYIEVI